MFYSLIQLFMIIVLGAFQFFVPRLTRADLWFSVTIDPAFRSTGDAHLIERGYRKAVVIHAFIALAVGVAATVLHNPELFPIPIVWLLIGSTVAFLRARRLVLPHAVPPSTVREASLASQVDSVPGGILGQLGPFAILGAAAIWLADQWVEIPANVPVHFNGSNQVDRWAPKTVGTVFGPLMVGVGMCLFLIAMSALITRVRRIRVSGTAGQFEAKFRRTTRGVMLATEYLMAIIFSLVSVAIATGLQWPLYVTMVLPIIFVTGIIVAMVSIGQGGSRLAAAEPAGAPAGDRTQDSAWKWGLFYVNRNDPALFIEKRFGIGYTLNFGHRWAMLLLVAMILFPALLSFVVKLLSH